MSPDPPRPALRRPFARWILASAALLPPGATPSPRVAAVAYETDGVTIADRSGSGGITLALSDWGRGGALVRAEPVAPVRANGVEYRRDGIVEWWRTSSDGLEQGFTVPTPPAGTGPLELDVEIRGARARIDSTLTTADLLGDGEPLRLSGLAASDALGHRLPAWLEPTARGLRLLVDDTGAIGAVTVDPLLGAPAWTAESDKANAEFGASVSSAGDVDGDGYADVVVGAAAGGKGQDGKAHVYLGSATGLATSAVWTASSPAAASWFGYGVAAAGDVDGDGYADVLVGELTGAYVYPGSAAGPAATPGWTGTGIGNYGQSVASAGDVNGDGYSDVLIGAPYYTDGQMDEGEALLYLGSAAGVAANPAWTAESQQLDAFLGTSVASAGDVDGDGFDDVVVGAIDYDNGQTNEGRASVYLGEPAGLARPLGPRSRTRAGRRSADPSRRRET